MYQNAFSYPIVKTCGKALLGMSGALVTANVATYAIFYGQEGFYEIEKFKQETNECKKLQEALQSGTQNAIKKELFPSPREAMGGMRGRILIAEKSSDLCTVLEARKRRAE